MSHILDSDNEYLLCVQLTDTHLFKDPQGKLLNVPTAQSLKKVIELVNEEQPHVDLVVVTGDISQDQTLGSYQLFQEHIKAINALSLWVPGNHDDFSVIENLDTFKQHLAFSYDLGEHWRVIMLNSQVLSEKHGRVSQQQLEDLLSSLSSTKRFHMVCLHHQVFSTNARWINDMRLEESWHLLDSLEYFLNGNVILCGHIHHAVELYYRGVYLFSTPSTCIQFAPDSTSFELDNVAPGYRWIKLYPDGVIDTGVSRLKENPFQVDLVASYY